jgi:high-affinity nickel-transport protein
MAYGWASVQPVRKIYYSITVTALSVAVALLVGGVQVLDVLGLASVSLDAMGYVIALMFAVTWAIAVAIWRFGRIEERWSVRPSAASR